jgi:DNA-binding transcriptional ArsR family regulator
MAKYLDGLDGVATALAHPGRRQVVDRLRAGPASSSELARLLGIGLPAVTKHLALLAGAGVIHSAKSGRVVTHVLDNDRLHVYATWLATRDSFWQHQLDALADHLEST